MADDLSQRRVLNRWTLSLFGVESLEDIAEHLKDPDLEGFEATSPWSGPTVARQAGRTA